jgi:lipopolysaccharide export LptBFGC system permease protein LptF
MAVISAIFTGFLFSVILVTTKELVEVYKFPPMQLNFDVNLIYGTILFVFYWQYKHQFSLHDIFLSLISFYF